MTSRSDEINIIVQIKAKEGSEAELLEAMSAMVPHSTSEAGCERFELIRSKEDSRQFALVERFKDQAALDIHVNTDYVKEFLDRKAPELAEPPTVTFYERIL